MARRNGAPEVNAGSMADIAFLLLIFFLVTTTIETDAGLDRMLPPIEPPEDDVVIKQKNIFTVNVNRNGQLLVEEELMDIKNLRAAAVAFLDNGGLKPGEEGYCNYCKGERDPGSSDNPGKAIISLKNDRGTKYKTYLEVYNELKAAYRELWDESSRRKFGKDYEFLNRTQQKEVRSQIPLVISEAEPTNFGEEN